MTLEAKRKLFFIVGGAVILLTLIVLLMAPSGDSGSPTIAPADPESNQGQTGVQYDGFTELTTQGLTQDQSEGLKFALFNFNKDAKKFVTNPASVKQAPYDRDNPTDFILMTFTLTVDDKATYQASLEKYVDLSTIRLYLKDKSGQQVFDSQPVDRTRIQAVEGPDSQVYD